MHKPTTSKDAIYIKRQKDISPSGSSLENKNRDKKQNDAEITKEISNNNGVFTMACNKYSKGNPIKWITLNNAVTMNATRKACGGPNKCLTIILIIKNDISRDKHNAKIEKVM